MKKVKVGFWKEGESEVLPSHLFPTRHHQQEYEYVNSTSTDALQYTSKRPYPYEIVGSTDLFVNSSDTAMQVKSLQLEFDFKNPRQ